MVRVQRKTPKEVHHSTKFSKRSKPRVIFRKERTDLLFDMAPPLQESLNVQECLKFKMLHDKHFFRASALTPFSFKKLNHGHKKTTELSLIYQNRPRGPPAAGCKNLGFGANLDPSEQHWISRKIFMIRPAKEILSSTVQGASSPSDQEASSPSTVPMETAPPLSASSSSNIPAVAPPLPQYEEREKEIHPPESLIPGGAPIIPARVGGGKQTYRGNIGCSTKKNIFGTLPQAENF